ncbi:MAG: hypothetical protein K2W96_00765, partial [Gemmataceae bacterium]|nr:hypothetical protein [Gemmataceae bacterium]
MPALLALLALAVAPPATPPDLILELRRCYARPPKEDLLPPSLKAAAEALSSEAPEKRRRATRRLLAAMKQSLADERSGTRWRRGAPEEGEPRMPAPVLIRLGIARALEATEPSAETAPLAEWSIDEEPRSLAQAGFAHLREDSDRGRALARRIVGRRHPDAHLLAAALEALASTEASVPRPLLEELAQHHHGDVRKAARAAAKLPLAAFDPVQAMGCPPVRALLRRIGEELIDLPPLGDELARLRVPGLINAEDEVEARGWLLPAKGAASSCSRGSRCWTTRTVKARPWPGAGLASNISLPPRRSPAWRRMRKACSSPTGWC